MSVSYGATRVLDRVSLDVERGEMIALLGSSGCGKTTLLRSIAGFVTPDEGTILVDGRDITRLPPEKRADGDDVPVLCAVAAHERGRQHRLRPAHARLEERRDREARGRDAEAAAARRLHASGRSTQLSGGQRQRVALGRALAVDPHLLLLDEPMSNLDYKVRLELRHELRALQRRVGITAVYVTHDREEALTLADRIAVIDAGRIVQIGTPEEIFHRPESAFVAGFMGADNALDLVRRASGTLPRRSRARPPRRALRAHFRSDARTLAAHAVRPRAGRAGAARASSRNRCTSGTAIAIACAPTAPRSGSRHRTASRKGRRPPSSCRARRCCCFQVAVP